MTLLSWHNLIFLIPLGVGCLLGIGAALGLAGDGAAAGEHEAAGDQASDRPGDGDAGWSLAIGRVPLTVSLMLLSLSFGGIGLSIIYLLGGLIHERAAVTLAAAGVAALASLWISGGAVRLFARKLPLLESQTVARGDLRGATGRAILAVGPVTGLAQVHDRRGNLHQVACRTLSGEALPAGTEVLLIEYDERDGVFRVASNPLAEAPPRGRPQSDPT